MKVKERLVDLRAFVAAITIVCVCLYAGDASLYNYHSIKWILLLVLLCWFWKKFLRENKLSREEKIVACITSVLLSFSTILSMSYSNRNSWGMLIEGKWERIKTVLIAIGYSYLFYIPLVFIVRSFGEKKENSQKNIRFWDSCSSKRIAIILFVLYLPFVLINFPGTMAGDTPSQVLQCYNISSGISYLNMDDSVIKLNNHHPVAHTLLLKGCLILGKILVGTDNAGAFLYSVVQLAVVIFCFARVFDYLKKWKVPERVRSAGLIFYCLCPVIYGYLNVVVKDTIYAAFFTLFVCRVADIHLKKKIQKKDIWFLIIDGIFLILFRNNGLYIGAITSFFLLLFEKRNRKYFAYVMIALLSFNILYTKIVFPVCGIPEGSKREAFSIPFQQTARYVKYYGDEVTEEEKEAIEQILDYDALAENYYPINSDDVKKTYNEEATGEDLKKYFKCWFEMFLKHPACYVQATFNNTYGYFDLNTSYGYTIGDIEGEYFEELEKYDCYFYYPLRMNRLRININNFLANLSNIPGVQLFTSAAFYNWWTILIGIYFLMKRNKKKLFICIPFFINILVCIASPLSGNVRYALPVIFALPVLYSCIFCEPEV